MREVSCKILTVDQEKLSYLTCYGQVCVHKVEVIRRYLR